MASEGKERKRKAGADQLNAPHKKSKKPAHNEKVNLAEEKVQKDIQVHSKISKKHKSEGTAQLLRPLKQKPIEDAAKSKQPRKRAADFLDDASENGVPGQSVQVPVSATFGPASEKASKKDSKKLNSDAAARGLPEVDPATTANPPKKSKKSKKSKKKAPTITVNENIFGSTDSENEIDVGASLTMKVDQLRPKTSTDVVIHKTKHQSTAGTGVQKRMDGHGNREESSDDDESDEDSTVENFRKFASIKDEKKTVMKSSSREAYGAEHFSESQDESDSNNVSEDKSTELLAGFDSDSEDDDQDTTPFNPDKLVPVPKKAKNQLKNLERKENEKPGTMYVGHIPHGFYEHQMRAYFSQFGDIKNLRLSRNKKTGASKHYAFVEFESEEVAKIAAQAMDNYLMFGHILKAKFTPSDTLHSDTWKGANKRFRKIPYNMLEKKKLEAPKTVEKWEAKIAKEQLRREEKNKKLKEKLGYEVDLPTMKNPSDVLGKRTLQEERLAAVDFPDEGAAGQMERFLDSGAEASDLVAAHQVGNHEGVVESYGTQQRQAAEALHQPDGESRPAKAVETPTGTPKKALPAKPMDPDILAQLKTVAKLSPLPQKVSEAPQPVSGMEKVTNEDPKQQKKRGNKTKKAKQAAPPQQNGAADPVTSETAGVQTLTQATTAPSTGTTEQEVPLSPTSKDNGDNDLADDLTGTNVTNKEHKKKRARHRHKGAFMGSVPANEAVTAVLPSQNGVIPATFAGKASKRDKKQKA